MRGSLSTLRTSGDHLYWVEARPLEAGRQVVVRGRPGERGGVVEIAPHPLSARSRVHEYGGGALCPLDTAAICIVDASDQRIYRIDLAGGDTPAGPPALVPLTPSPPPGERWNHGDLWGWPDGRFLLAVRERFEAGEGSAPRRSLVAVPSRSVGSGSVPTESDTATVLWERSDFVAAARVGPLAPGGRWLAWVTWDHPHMPWDSSTVWVGRVLVDAPGSAGESAGDGAPALVDARPIAGGAGDSVGQPTWCEDGSLVFTFDHDGWWQPWRWHPTAGLARVSDRAAEFHAPDWQLGRCTLAALQQGRLACCWRERGRDHLGVLDLSSGGVETLEQPCVSISSVCAGPWGLAWIGATPWCPQAVWWLPPRPGGVPRPLAPVSEPLDRGDVSVGEPVAVRHRVGTDAVSLEAIVYRPRSRVVDGPEGERPPLVVDCHGGPTGSVEPGWDAVVQYFTTRGFAVARVDYRGSSGHGRAFRRALDGRWGQADVDDCVAVADHLARCGEVDGSRMAIRGSSAGGLTALNALIRSRLFVAAVSWYGVTDLLALASVTHDFEARYLDRLVGALPAAAAEYRRRSPVRRARDLRGAVLVLQGLDDPVVPPSQSEALVREVRERGGRCDYLTFAQEGHGFRRAETIEAALRAEERFVLQVMGIDAEVDPPARDGPGGVATGGRPEPSGRAP